MAAEKEFENKVKAFLKEQGCWFIKYWGGGGFTKSGVPDLLVCCKGSFLGVELKARSGRPSVLQVRELGRIRSAGGYAVLLYPQDFDLFKELVHYLSVGDTESADTCRLLFNQRLEQWERKYGIGVPK